ncbi:MAG: DUF3467 domain-containing protein [Planctomycetaceae bacterium]|jgi:hypothetical protein|nr:DUF3467 domain-containing protein [Planctomycetaceae bacterium]
MSQDQIQQSENAAPESSERSQSQQQAPQVRFDDSKVTATYANFCRVTGTPEELIIDFGLNPQPVGLPTVPIVVTDRIVTNFYTAKRMLYALQATIQRHEQTFGVLETDVQKRVKTQ